MASSDVIAGPDSAAYLAYDYGIRFESAQKFIALASAKSRTQAATELGVSLVEISPLAKMEMPSVEVIQKMAGHLNENPAAIEALIRGFITDLKQE
jgi:hypothetical protein